MSWIAYHMVPIDFGWEHLPTVQDYAAALGRKIGEIAVDEDFDRPELMRFISDFKTAKALATAKGWEGDYRTGSEPRVFFLPDDGGFEYAFAWKQDNNGSTFIVSPKPLPWLSQLT